MRRQFYCPIIVLSLALAGFDVNLNHSLPFHVLFYGYFSCILSFSFEARTRLQETIGFCEMAYLCPHHFKGKKPCSMRPLLPLSDFTSNILSKIFRIIENVGLSIITRGLWDLHIPIQGEHEI